MVITSRARRNPITSWRAWRRHVLLPARLHTAMDDDLVTNFVAAEPAPISRSAARTKLRRLQRHKGLVSLLR